VDLAVHVSAPRALRPPLRTVIEETWRTFFTKHAGHAVKYGQQPERAAVGPTRRLVLSMSGYPCRGWRDNSNKRGIIIDVTSCGVVFFRPKREGHFRVFIFSRYVLSKATSLLSCRAFSRSFALFARFERKDRPSSGFAPTRNSWMNPSRPVSRWVFCMITRRDVFALADTILIFEWWFFIPRITFHGPAVPPCFTDEGS
jgi:hypothetical protein